MMGVALCVPIDPRLPNHGRPTTRLRMPMTLRGLPERRTGARLVLSPSLRNRMYLMTSVTLCCEFSEEPNL